MKPRRIAVILLLSVMLSGCFASANAKTDTGSSSADTAVVTTAPETTEAAAIAVNSTDNAVFDTITPDEDAPDDMPALYINLDNGVTQGSISHDEYTGAVIALDGRGLTDSVSERAAEIKGRGNYSWSLPKKPYNIKFEEKVSLCGMGAAKRWVLIANWSDKTLLRNYLTLTLALDCGITCGTECAQVNLYCNGKYRGVYLLTEKVEIDDERVDIDEDSGAMLFEIEQTYRHSDCTGHVTTNAGVHIMLKEPSIDELDPDELETMLDRALGIFNAAEKAMKRGHADWDKYIDIDSFVKWYMVNEFVKNYDSIFVTSCYCYIGDDGRLYMGPPWDFDTCLGNQDVATCLNPEGWYIKNSPWYKLLYQSGDFKYMVSQKWKQLRDDGIIDKLYDSVDTVSAATAESVALNYEIWPDALEYNGLRGDKSFYKYDYELTYLKTYITTRTAWLDKQLGYAG